MDLKVGDEVRVFDRNGSHMGQPPGGWPGKVVKIGRKYATVEYGSRSDLFDKETGRRNNDGYRHLKTPEQVALEEREVHAVKALRSHGIELRHGHRLSLEQVEALAQVVATFAETAPEVSG